MATRLGAPASGGSPSAEGTLPPFWASARRHLRKDRAMAAIMDAHPKVKLVSRGDAFSTLARSIVGQQISVKAAASVWARVLDRCVEEGEPIAPGHILRRRIPTLRACGLSERKAEYLRDLASHFRSGRLDHAQLAALDDEGVIECLTEIRGIGRWTAEMFLIFNLMRPDVLPLDDLGLLKAVGRHYFDGELPASLMRGEGRARVVAAAQRWAPYRSVATWYLWRSLDPVPVEY